MGIKSTLSTIGHDIVSVTSKAVTFIEEQFGGANGAAKKAAVMAIVAGFLGTIGKTDIASTTTAKLSVLIDDIVAIANEIGVFTHGA